MGSKLIVESTKSVGTTFSFDLNLEIVNNENLVIISQQVKENVFKNKKALLVEDNEMNRFIAIQSLSYLGFEVIEAENGKIAIDKVSSFEFDLILMDIQMPVMDGLEATGYIRNQLKNNTPIIALTANAFKHDIELYMSKGMNDYIIKPYDEDDFFRKIEYVMLFKNETKLKNASPQHEEQPLFDLAVLEKMSRGDQSFIRKMMSIFIDVTKENTVKMEQFLVQDDWKNMKSVAHKIKPSIDQLEIKSLKEIIRWLEQYDPETMSKTTWTTNVKTTISVLNEVKNKFEQKISNIQ
jgi:CheY-like chemotaxis protein